MINRRGWWLEGERGGKEEERGTADGNVYSSARPALLCHRIQMLLEITSLSTSEGFEMQDPGAAPQTSRIAGLLRRI